MLIKNIFFSLFVLLSLAIGTPSLAGITQDKELKELDIIQSNLDTQKEWITYRHDQAVAICYHQFWMQRCMDKARVQFLKESKVVRDQEIALHDRQRYVNEVIKDEVVI
jgi:hypothetical protein